MKLRQPSALLLIALLLGGATCSSGIKSHGANTYRVEGSSEFGLSAAKGRAFEDASEYCSSSGQPVQEISSRADSHLDIFGDRIETFELVFQCGSAGGVQSAAGPQPPAAAPRQLPPTQKPDPAVLAAREAERRADLDARAAEQDAWRAYQICGGGRHDVQTAGNACGYAIDSGLLPPLAVSNSYYNRALLYAGIGNYEYAVADLDNVLRLSPNDQKAYQLRQRFTQAAMPPMYNIYYEGLYCAGVPKDTIFSPAAELFLTTSVIPLDDPAAARKSVHPGKGTYYPNVKPGVVRKPHSHIWAGRQNRIRLTASLWERDGGGAEVEAVGFLVFQLALAAKGGRTAARQPAPTRHSYARLLDGSKKIPSPPKQASAPMQPTGKFADALFGTGHDLLGISYFSEIDLSYFVGRPKKNYDGILHHLVTSHRQGGADCRAYFSVETS